MRARRSSVSSSGGTTEEMPTPSTSPSDRPTEAKSARKSIAYSSSVFSPSVAPPQRPVGVIGDHADEYPGQESGRQGYQQLAARKLHEDPAKPDPGHNGQHKTGQATGHRTRHYAGHNCGNVECRRRTRNIGDANEPNGRVGESNRKTAADGRHGDLKSRDPHVHPSVPVLPRRYRTKPDCSVRPVRLLGMPASLLRYRSLPL